MLNTATHTSYNGRQTSDSSEILSTKNYAIFRFSEFNRAIDETHLANLIDAIAAKDLLRHYPILVNREMIVIDGQHRLKAAEVLEKRIYYQIVDDMTVPDVIEIADIPKRWTLIDHCRHWGARGNEHYKAIWDFHLKYPWMPFNLITKYTVSNSAEMSWAKAFRRGLATSDPLPRLEKLADMAYDFKPYLRTYKSQNFMYALSALTDIPNYSHETMMARLEYQSTRLVPCATTKQYLELLASIYNFRTHDENRIDISDYERRRVQRGNRNRQRASGRNTETGRGIGTSSSS